MPTIIYHLRPVFPMFTLSSSCVMGGVGQSSAPNMRHLQYAYLNHMRHTCILARNMLKWAPEPAEIRCEVLQEGHVGLGSQTLLSGVISAWSIRYLHCKSILWLFLQPYARFDTAFMLQGGCSFLPPGASEAREVEEGSVRALQLGLENICIIWYQFGVAALLC